MSNELPEPWGSALSPKGVHSYRDLATGLDISTGTAYRLVTGRTSPRTVQRAADKYFDGDANKVYEMRASTLKGYGPWEPPEAVMLLGPQQRAALEAVIAAMVPEEHRATGGEQGEQRDTPATKVDPPDEGGSVTPIKKPPPRTPSGAARQAEKPAARTTGKGTRAQRDSGQTE